MDTAEIETFLALAEELHFRRTADRLRLPQARVSRLIATLEQRAGGKLFDRTSRTVRITPLGDRLRDQVQPAYAQLRAAMEDARRTARETAGILRIGFTVTTQGEALTRLVTAFEAGNPERRAMLREVDLADPYAAMRHGEIDVLVNWLVADQPDLTVGPVIEYRDRVLAVGSSHPLAQRPSVAADELADFELTGFASLPSVLTDAIIPPRTPSGRPTCRSLFTGGINDLQAEIACGRAVHPTVAGVVLLRRDDIVLVTITGLPPLPLGLLWCTAHENARVRALAATTAVIGQQDGHRIWSPERTAFG